MQEFCALERRWSSGSDCSSDIRLDQKATDALERARLQSVVRIRAALLALEQPRIHQLLEVVAHRRLLDPEQRLELADADRLPIRLQEAVENLEPVPIRERLEEPLELGCLLRRQSRPGDRRAALDEWKLLHAGAWYRPLSMSPDTTKRPGGRFVADRYRSEGEKPQVLLAAFTARVKFVLARLSCLGVSEMKSARFAIATSLSTM
jgi:hypothetical protein